MRRAKLGERLETEGKSFEQLDAFHTSNYRFASTFLGGLTVLEVGSGAGYGAAYLAQHGPTAVLGVDYDEDVIAEAKTKYCTVANLRFETADACKLPFGDASFDAVVALEVIEHLDGYRRFVEDAARLTRSIFLVSTPNRNITSPTHEKPSFPFHVHEFFPEELRCLLLEHFDSVTMYGLFHVNEQVKSVVTTYRNSLRYRLLQRAAQLEIVRRAARNLPASLKRLVTAPPQVELQEADLEFREEECEHADNLFAIAVFSTPKKPPATRRQVPER